MVQDKVCPEGAVFVYGSNKSGIHGAGAAKTARVKYGAIWGQGWGRQGSSFAIPTKGFKLEVLSLVEIAYYVGKFIAYTELHPEETFFVTRIGCGLANYRDEEIAPFFKDAPKNCILPHGW